MTKRKKTSREKKALVGALCTAAVILAGSTFAWFTSTDTVTNRLTASADYGVAITESFNPPKSMTPGQKVNKDVSVVNTGNIDALVRLAFENKLELNAYGVTPLTVTRTKVFSYSKYATASDVPDSAVKTLAEDLYDSDKFDGIDDEVSGKEDYCIGQIMSALKEKFASEVELTVDAYGDVYDKRQEIEGKITVTYQKTDGSTGTVTIEDTGIYGTDTDVEAYQLGEFTVTGTDDLADAIKLNKEAGTAKDGTPIPDEVTALQAGGQLVVAANKALSPNEQAVAAGNVGNDFTRYTPTDKGLYLFRRTTNDTAGSYGTYVGYYYDGAGNYYSITGADEDGNLTDKNKATKDNTVLNPITITATQVKVPDTSSVDSVIVTKIEDVALKTEKLIQDAEDNVTITFGTYTEGEDNRTSESFTPVVTVKGTDATEDSEDIISINQQGYNAIEIRYAGADAEDGNEEDDDVVFYVLLGKDWNKYWYYENDTTDDKEVGYFYLIDDLEAGQASHKLIDAVILSAETTSGSFSNLTYDIIAKIDSIQVAYDENDNETTKAVPENWKKANTVAQGLYKKDGTTATSGDNEIVNAFGAPNADINVDYYSAD